MKDEENTYVAREEALQYFKDRQDAKRWRKLIRLIGSPQDGSDITVKLFWDDTTNTPWIIVGKEQSCCEHGDFDTLIDSIPEP